MMNHYDFREARILDMTRSQALGLLGFKPTDNPTPAELKAAQRAAARDAHPDKGGSTEKMQDVNRAFDFLIEHSSESSYDRRDPDSGQVPFRPEDVLNRELEKFPKKHAWWSPGKNCAINVTLLGGINLWSFSILPQFYKNIYRPAMNGKPEGIVIDPDWHPLRQDFSDPSPDLMEKLVHFAKNEDTIKDAVAKQLRWIEEKFSCKIPSAVEAKLIKDADKVAKRRWGTNGLRTRKILVPFDGSKSIELGSWD
jgi:curved DNA-binding protein CbpA